MGILTVTYYHLPISRKPIKPKHVKPKPLIPIKPKSTRLSLALLSPKPIKPKFIKEVV